MAKLMSVTSRVSFGTVSIAKIYKRGPGNYVPWYSINPSTGICGGAITLGSANALDFRITYTENYFSDDSSAYGVCSYGNNLYEWMEISAHEVTHILDILVAPGGSEEEYVKGTIVEYIKSGGHDTAPMEIFAEQSSIKFVQFYVWINFNYGINALENLFSSPYSDEFKINQIETWWQSFPYKW